jgi:hypothetical protein
MVFEFVPHHCACCGRLRLLRVGFHSKHNLCSFCRNGELHAHLAVQVLAACGVQFETPENDCPDLSQWKMFKIDQTCRELLHDVKVQL